MKALIIGNGNVGKALSRALSDFNWQNSFFSGRRSDDLFVKEALNADVVFIAISTKDKGEIELSFILKCLELGKPVVTCAKGALAWHFDTLKPHLRKIGHSTTVGGPSGMLALAESPRFGKIEVSAIVNGTLNFLFWAVENGATPNEALAQAQREKLCEPGANSLGNIVNCEIQDALRKASILFNVLLVGPAISPDDFSYSVFAEQEIHDLLRDGRQRRFVVTIQQVERHRFFFEAFCMNARPWLITGSFTERAEEMFSGHIGGARNCLAITTPGIGREIASGLGAGAQATADAMLGDARLLLHAI